MNKSLSFFYLVSTVSDVILNLNVTVMSLVLISYGLWFFFRTIAHSVLFAYDIVLIDELRDDADANLKRWHEALESKGFKIRRVCVNCNFHKDVKRAETSFKI